MDEIYEFLKSGPYFLCTVDEEGNPQTRPFGICNEFEGGLYIQTGRHKAVYRQLKAHPRATISAMGKPGWIRIWCDLIEDDRIEAEAAALEAQPRLKDKGYEVGDGNNVVFRMENVKAVLVGYDDQIREII